MLTPEQIQKIAASRGDTVTNSSPGQVSLASNPADEFAKSVGYQPEARPGFLSRVKDDINKRINNAADAQLEAIQGKQSPLRATAHTIGQGAAAVSDVVGEGIKSVVDLLPNH